MKAYINSDKLARLRKGMVDGAETTAIDFIIACLEPAEPMEKLLGEDVCGDKSVKAYGYRKDGVVYVTREEVEPTKEPECTHNWRVASSTVKELACTKCGKIEKNEPTNRLEEIRRKALDGKANPYDNEAQTDAQYLLSEIDRLEKALEKICSDDVDVDGFNDAVGKHVFHIAQEALNPKDND